MYTTTSYDGGITIASERVQRQIDRPLDEAKEAVSKEHWEIVGHRASPRPKDGLTERDRYVI